MSQKQIANDLSRRLIRRLNSLGFNLKEEHYYVVRTYAGSDQKSKGAWSWSLHQVPLMQPLPHGSLPDGNLGGYSGLSDTLRAKAISVTWSGGVVAGWGNTRTWSIDIEPNFTADKVSINSKDVTGKPDEIAVYV